MKLRDLHVRDRFYYQGKKYCVFITLRDEFKPEVFNVHCLDWPGSIKVCKFSSEIEVKPIITPKRG